jgi:hypothetical protein
VREVAPFSDKLEARIEEGYRKYRYFHMRTNVEVRILTNESNGIYHATFDGVKALCGTRCTLSENKAGRCEEPSKSIMMCERCAYLIRRVKE